MDDKGQWRNRKECLSKIEKLRDRESETECE